MITVGMDVHKSYSFLTAIDAQGAVLDQSRVANTKRQLGQYFQRFDHPPQVAVESCWNWQWIHELLVRKGCTVHLAHPLKAKAIASAKIKTDKVDSTILANLLRTGLLPTAYIATPEERQWRELLRHRMSLVQTRTRLANRVRALLAQNGLTFPGRTLFTQSGRLYLEKLALPIFQRQRLDQWLAQEQLLAEQIEQLDQTIAQQAMASTQARLLTTIPGVGAFTALVLLAELGDIHRFPSAGHLASYCGLVPSLHQSGQTRYTGHITKQGSKYARYVLVQAAHHAARGPFRAFFRKISSKRGPSIAFVAIARKLAVAVFHILKEEEPFLLNMAG